jgi:hypothetical protein
MALTAEQYSQLAAANERAAADPFVPAKQSSDFAKKADLYRLLAKLAAKLEARNVSSNKGAGRLSRSADRKLPKRPPPPLDEKPTQKEPETSEYLQAVRLLSLRWRLLQLGREMPSFTNRSPRSAR